MQKTKYYIGILFIAVLFNSSSYPSKKSYADLYEDQKIFMAKSCVSADNYRMMYHGWGTKEERVYLDEKSPLLIPDTVLFRERYNAPFHLSRIIHNKEERKEFNRKIKEGEKLPMTCITYEQAQLYLDCLTKIKMFSPDEISIRYGVSIQYSLPTLEEYEFALKKKILTDGAEYLADGNIVLIDTKNKKLEVVTSTEIPVRFRIVIHRIS